MLNMSIDFTGYIQSRHHKNEQRKLERDKNELLAAIDEAKCELDDAVRNMNFVSDPLLLDHYTFKVKAAETKYRYLMCQAREMGHVNRDFENKSEGNEFIN